MSSYSSDHASALADVGAAGGSVTFLVSSPGTYTPSTGVWTTPATASVSGKAIEEVGDPDLYRDLGLTQADPATLFFVPSTYGQVPALGASCTWGGVVRTVKNVSPFAPDGTAIFSRCVVSS